MTQFLGNFQLVATLPPPETLQSSIKPEKPEKRPLPSLGVGKEAKREKARGSPFPFPQRPAVAGAEQRCGQKGPLCAQSSSPTAAVRTSHGPAGPAPPSSNSPQSSERRERAPPGQKHTAQTSQTEARAAGRLRRNSHQPGTLERSERAVPARASPQVSAQLTCFCRATAFPPLGSSPAESPARDESGAGQPDRRGRPVSGQQQRGAGARRALLHPGVRGDRRRLRGGRPRRAQPVYHARGSDRRHVRALAHRGLRHLLLGLQPSHQVRGHDQLPGEGPETV